MRIGFDAKWLFNGNPSGRIVVKNLLEKLLELNTANELYIILNKKDINKTFPFKNDNVKLIYVWGGINLLSNIIVVPIVLLKYKIDVCVFQYFAPVFGKFKKIVYIHDVIFKSHPEFFTLKERIYFFPMKFLAKRSHGIITVSEYEKKKIKQFHFLGSKTKICVVYNGVDGKYKPKKYFDSQVIERLRLKYNLPERFLLYVGRLNGRKNILNLIKSIIYLKNKEIKLVLCGKYDWKMFNLPQKIEELGLNDRVLLLGYICDDELPILYSLASVFCYVSFEEGFGLPPLESLASGVPNDPENIAEKIDLILSSSDIRKTKIDIGLNRTKGFNWQNSAKVLLQFCEHILET
jgi:glycosyltransferase involved in cell wall biosynthesis